MIPSEDLKLLSIHRDNLGEVRETRGIKYLKVDACCDILPHVNAWLSDCRDAAMKVKPLLNFQLFTPMNVPPSTYQIVCYKIYELTNT